MPDDEKKKGKFPFTVTKKGGKFVITDPKGKEVGESDDEDKAKEMAKKMAAKMAAADEDKTGDEGEDDDEDKKKGKPFARIPDVEIMRVGKWNGVPITERDLDDMVASFGKVGFEPALKLDRGGDRKTHQDGGPAFGYADSLKRIGKVLLASFKDVPPELIEAIKEKRYNRVSAEIFPDFERNGKTFRRVLKAVELMGATVPAVADLKPVSESLGFSIDFANNDYMTVTVDFSEEDDDMGLREELKQARAEIARLKMAKGGEDTFADSAEYRRMSRRIHDLEEQNRSDAIAKVVAMCKLPAIRDAVTLFADWGTQRDEDEVLSFSDGSTGGPLKAVEQFVSKLNGIIEKHFDETAVVKLNRPDDAPPENSEEAAERINQLRQEFSKKNSGADEDAFMTFLTNEHPEVLEMYARG